MVVSRINTLIFVAIFFGLWILAWIVHNLLFHTSSPEGSLITADTVYWVTAKLLVWLVYPILYFRKKTKNQVQLVGLELKNLKKGFLFGLGASLIWVAVSLILQHSFKLPAGQYWLVAYVVLLTPVIEEVMFRGYILGSLMTNTPQFYIANIITSLLFVAVHCIGWSFQGLLIVNAGSVTVVSIVVLSLVLGYVRFKSNSLLASIMLHTSNNFFSLFIKN